ncbi:MAG TPA: hypothetical protein VHT91_35755 [Kofleriaceae bacterium]|nr:hypothetical protein [Kofleriaceae bacterium]
MNGAAKAFSQAQEAMLSGDIGRAADLYELADELSPSAPALRNATRARYAAGHLAMAATNAARLLRRYPSDKESREIADAILAKLAPQLAQLDVTCSTPCTLLIDGKVVASVASEQHSVFGQPGGRSLTAVFEDGRKTTNQVTALANHITTMRLEPTPVAARPAARPAAAAAEASRPGNSEAHITRRASGASHGLSRWWVVGGGAVTLGLGVATTLSGLSTLSTRDQIRDAVAAGNNASAQALYDSGRDQQTRTNVLLGVTIASGVATGVLAVFTDWAGRSERELAIVPGRDGASLVYGGAF